MVAVRGATSANSGDGNTGTLDLTFPATTTDGDVALVVAGWNSSGYTLTMPAEWTAYAPQDIASTISSRAWTRALTAADAGTVATVTSTSNGRCGAVMVVLSDAGTVEAPTTAVDPNNDSDQPLPAIDPSATSLVVGLLALNYNAAGTSCSPPAGWTERGDTITTNGSGRKMGAWAGTYDTVSDAAVAASSVTVDGGLAHGASWSFAVNEVATAPNSGSASGSWAFTGTASGSIDHSGDAAGSHTWTGAAAGSTTHQGSATGAHAWNGATTGSTTHSGSATGAHAWSGTATGSRPSQGSAVGSWSFTGTASGTAPSDVPARDINLSAAATSSDWTPGIAEVQWAAAATSGNPIAGAAVTVDWTAATITGNPLAAAATSGNPISAGATTAAWTASPLWIEEK